MASFGCDGDYKLSAATSIESARVLALYSRFGHQVVYNRGAKLYVNSRHGRLGSVHWKSPTQVWETYITDDHFR